MNYTDFIAAKATAALHTDSIQTTTDELNPALYPFQRDIVRWALAKGRTAIFADCGLGKTAMQLEWARMVCRQRGGSVLICPSCGIKVPDKLCPICGTEI